VNRVVNWLTGGRQESQGTDGYEISDMVTCKSWMGCACERVVWTRWDGRTGDERSDERVEDKPEEDARRPGFRKMRASNPYESSSRKIGVTHRKQCQLRHDAGKVFRRSNKATGEIFICHDQEVSEESRA
jgi:hypothetical protein